MRVLAVDIGTIRLGLAVSDPLQITAQPLPTREGGEARHICRTVLKIIQEYEQSDRSQDHVETVVIGHPVHLDGKPSEMSILAEKCVGLLQEYIRQNISRGIAVVLKDERLTSAAAEKVMLEGGARREERRRKKDRIAAQLILQGYLDAQRHSH
jgi:putative Holliday junction resolvase